MIDKLSRFLVGRKLYHNLIQGPGFVKTMTRTKRNGSYKNIFKNQDCLTWREKMITMLKYIQSEDNQFPFLFSPEKIKLERECLDFSKNVG